MVFKKTSPLGGSTGDNCDCQRTDRATAVGRQSYRRKGERRCHEESAGPSDESNRIIPFGELGQPGNERLWINRPAETIANRCPLHGGSQKWYLNYVHICTQRG